MVHYRDLCSMLGLRYHALAGTGGKGQSTHWTADRDDVTVDVDNLRCTVEENL
jgi:hypothetical protein